MNTFEDRIRDAYTLADSWAPATAPRLRQAEPRRRPRFVAVTVTATVTAAVLIAGTVATGIVRGHDHRARDTVPSAVLRPTGLNQLRLYLCDKASLNPACNHRDATQAERAEILAELKRLPRVSSVVYVTEQQALIAARKLFAGKALANRLTLGDIPDSYRVTVRTPEDVKVVAALLTGHPAVDAVTTR